MDAVEIVDAAVSGGVVVYGSLPPGGRDLDIVARATDSVAIASALRGQGFVCRRGSSYARFDDCRIDAVEVKSAEQWSLSDAQIQQLFRHGIPLEGYRRLLRPAPHHALLILARRAAWSGALDDKRRTRLRDILREDPLVWERAAEVAQEWAAVSAIRLLHVLWTRGSAPLRLRVAALAERFVGQGQGQVEAYLRALRIMGDVRRKGRLVAISGLDGAGKSSIAFALSHAFEGAGHPTAIRWTRLAHNPALDRVALPVTRLLAVRPPTRHRSAGQGSVALDPSRLATTSQRLRQSSRLMTSLWAAIVAFDNARAQRTATIKDLREGRLVLSDRWTLDSAVHLRYRYGMDRTFRWQTALVRLMAPRPSLSLFIDVDAETAFRRKIDDYDVRQLSYHARLYRDIYRQHGALRIDGEKSKEVVHRRAIELVWRSWTP